MWAITGVSLAFPAAFRAVVTAVSPTAVQRTPQSDPSRAPRKQWRELLDAAQAAAPGLHVARVVLPLADRDALLVMFARTRPTPAGGADLTSIYVDPYTGERLSAPVPERTAGDILMAWTVPLHVGNFAGNGVRLAWLLFGLAPPVLFCTGFLMWWMRVVRRRLW
jgi:uncharacterized iron-regulated membrane protein